MLDMVNQLWIGIAINTLSAFVNQVCIFVFANLLASNCPLRDK